MELTAILTGRKAGEKQNRTAEDEAFIQRYGSADTVGQLRECEYLLRKNEMLFNMESEEDLIDCRIFEREALLARYQYLLRRARAERAAAAAAPQPERRTGGGPAAGGIPPPVRQRGDKKTGRFGHQTVRFGLPERDLTLSLRRVRSGGRGGQGRTPGQIVS